MRGSLPKQYCGREINKQKNEKGEKAIRNKNRKVKYDKKEEKCKAKITKFTYLKQVLMNKAGKITSWVNEREDLFI